MREINDEVLAGQIPEYVEPSIQQTPETPVNTQSQQAENTTMEVGQRPQVQSAGEYKVGDKLRHMPGIGAEDTLEDQELREREHISSVGDNLLVNRDIREGWIPVDRELLGDRSIFYPSDWQFRIRPATVEAIRNWSTIDEQNANSVDDVFNEILKSCISIQTSHGPLPWGNIRPWDRFFFVLLIREYTFVKGEAKLEFTEECPNCENPVKFTFNVSGLDYELPEPEVLKYYAPEEQKWVIDPVEFEVNEDPVTLYLPTLEREANIKAWIIERLRANKKVDQVFIKFLPWMAQRISKDQTVADRQIREYERTFKGWDTDMFSLMNDVLNNIMVVPSTKLQATGPLCGEECTAEMRFPDGVRSIFAVQNRHKKFGKK